MPEIAGKFSCEGCGKAYSFKPEYAGRLVKCKCGMTMRFPVSGGPAVARPGGLGLAAAGVAKHFPATGPVAESGLPAAAMTSGSAVEQAAPGPSADDLAGEFEQAFSGGEYEVAPAEPPPIRARTVVSPAAMGMGAVVPGAAVASPVLGYAGTRKRASVEEEIAKKSLVSDVYVPAGLIVVGVLLSYVDAYLYGLSNPILSTVYVFTVAVVNVVLVFTALMIAMKLIDLGFGPIGPALLKIAATAVLPAAIAGIIGHYTFFLINWSVSAICYYLLLFYLFEMDGQEMVITTTIIWGVWFLMNMFIVVLIASMIGVAIHAAGSGRPGSSLPGGGSFSAPAVLGGGGGAQGESSGESAAAAQVDAETEVEITSGKAVDAREWSRPAHADHTGVKRSAAEISQMVDLFQSSGARGVFVSGIKSDNNQQVASELIVQMPDEGDARAATLKVYDHVIGSSKPTEDAGQKNLSIPLD